MRFLLEYPRWKRVKLQLRNQGMVRLPDKHGLHNYSLPLFPPKFYPRVHLITTSALEQNAGHHLRLIEVHVDVIPHNHTENFHPAIDMVQRMIKNTV